MVRDDAMLGSGFEHQGGCSGSTHHQVAWEEDVVQSQLFETNNPHDMGLRFGSLFLLEGLHLRFFGGDEAFLILLDPSSIFRVPSRLGPLLRSDRGPGPSSGGRDARRDAPTSGFEVHGSNDASWVDHVESNPTRLGL